MSERQDSHAAKRHKAVWLDSIGDAPSVVYRLMMEIDKHEDLDEHPIRQSEAYNDAVRGLGWDIDWEAVRNARA